VEGEAAGSDRGDRSKGGGRERGVVGGLAHPGVILSPTRKKKIKSSSGREVEDRPHWDRVRGEEKGKVENSWERKCSVSKMQGGEALAVGGKRIDAGVNERFEKRSTRGERI